MSARPPLEPRDFEREQRCAQRLHRLRRALLWGVTAILVGLVVLVALPQRLPVHGVIWQPTADYPAPRGCLSELGAKALLVQWSAVYTPAHQKPSYRVSRAQLAAIARRGWVQGLLVGLAGEFDMRRARLRASFLARRSQRVHARLSRLGQGYYAPIEISPQWRSTRAIRDYLRALPRPLWVSVYGGYDLSNRVFGNWMATWLPAHVHVLYQDGVGTGQATAPRAARRVKALMHRFGAQRVAIVLEAFRRRQRRFEPAPIGAIARQLRAYRGLRVWLFSPRYMGCMRTVALKAYWYWDGPRAPWKGAFSQWVRFPPGNSRSSR